MKLIVQVLEAENLQLHSVNPGSLNPYCTITLMDTDSKSIGDSKQKTTVKKRTFNPSWRDLSFEIIPNMRYSGVRIKCIHKDLFQKHTIGEAFVPAEKFKEEMVESWQNLKKNGTTAGKVLVTIRNSKDMDTDDLKKRLEKIFDLSISNTNDIVSEVWCQRIKKRGVRYQGNMIVTATHLCFRADKKHRISDKIALKNVVDIQKDNGGVILYENLPDNKKKSYTYENFDESEKVELLIKRWKKTTGRKMTNQSYSVVESASEYTLSTSVERPKKENNNLLNSNNDPLDEPARKRGKIKSIRNAIFSRKKKVDSDGQPIESDRSKIDESSEAENDTLNDHSEIDNLDPDTLKVPQFPVANYHLMIKYTAESDRKTFFIRIDECNLNNSFRNIRIGDQVQFAFTINRKYTADSKVYFIDPNFSFSMKDPLIFDLEGDPKLLKISLFHTDARREIGVCLLDINIVENSWETSKLIMYDSLSEADLEKEEEFEESENINIKEITSPSNEKSTDPSIEITYLYIPRSPEVKKGTLTITIHKCANLLVSPSIGDNTYFVRLEFGKKVEKTGMQNTKNPRFNESFTYQLAAKEEEIPKSLHVSVWNCKSSEQNALVGYIIFYLDKLTTGVDIKSWYNLSASDLSVVSAENISKVTEQARELDEFFSAGEEPKKVVPDKGRFRQRTVEFGLELPKTQSEEDTIIVNKTIDISSKKILPIPVILGLVTLLLAILCYFLFL